MRNEQRKWQKLLDQDSLRWLIPLIILLLVTTRLVSVLSIYPGNATDEHGHMTVVTALANGRLETIQEMKLYTAYPYVLFNPTPYLPSAVTLKLFSFVDPSVLEMTKPLVGPFFKKSANLAARIGMLFWFSMFLVFLLKSTSDFAPLPRVLTLVTIGLLPEITFVQTYVNLDSMGISVVVYLFWSLRSNRLGHIAFSTFLVLGSKLTFLCVLPASLLYLVFLFPAVDRNGRIRSILLGFALPVVLGSWWFLVNYFYVSGNFHSYLGFEIVTTLFSEEGSGLKVFNSEFLPLSIKSMFAAFGYFNQWLPSKWFYAAWGAIFTLGLISMAWYMLRRGDRFSQFASVLAALTVAVNFAMHYFASFIGSFQPQGRYLFSSAMIALYFYVVGVCWIKIIWLRYTLLGVTISFFVLCATISLFVASENPFKVGFEL